MATQEIPAKSKDGLGLGLFGLLAVLTAGLVYTVSGTLKERIVEAGETAPKFTLKTDQGRQVSRADFGGKLLVLNFWATWCQPCVEEIPSLNEFAKKYSDQGVVVLGVSVDRNEKLYRDFVQRNKLAFLTMRDPEANLSGQYGTFKYPETYIIDRNGKVVQKIIGPQNWTDPAYLNFFQSLL